jgi:hypothetical protein
MLREMLDELRTDDDHPLDQVIGLERARICLFTGPDPVRLRTLWDEAERALEVLGASEDEAGLALVV